MENSEEQAGDNKPGESADNSMEICENEIAKNQEKMENIPSENVQSIEDPDPGTSGTSRGTNTTNSFESAPQKRFRNYRRRTFSSSSENSDASVTSQSDQKRSKSNSTGPQDQQTAVPQNNEQDNDGDDVHLTDDGSNLSLSDPEDEDNELLDIEANPDREANPNDSDDSSISSSIFSPLFYIFNSQERHLRDFSDSSSESDEDPENKKKLEDATKEILNRELPRHTWCSPKELRAREYGNVNSKMFEMKNYSSLNTVQRLELMSKLEKHQSCVNCLNFNRTGEFLLSGSDDLKIILWKWSIGVVAKQWKSLHTKNIFQTKFIEENTRHFKIISAAADGSICSNTIRTTECGDVSQKKLYTHAGSVHKIAVKKDVPWFLSAGEDAKVGQFDMRTKNVNFLVTVRDKSVKIPLFSISSHPNEDKFVISGKNQYVRVYDLRNCKKPLQKYCPTDLVTRKTLYRNYISCSVYNDNGTEILASYSDDYIYLFDTADTNENHYVHKYRGHSNCETIKGVNFFGPKSEFIVSGSDCGNVFFWEKEKEAIVQFLPADEEGVVNVLEPHPHIPLLATSGLDSDVKIFVPSNEEPKLSEKLEKCVYKNYKKKAEVLGRMVLPRNIILRNFNRRFRRLVQDDINDWFNSSSSSSDNI